MKSYISEGKLQMSWGLSITHTHAHAHYANTPPQKKQKKQQSVIMAEQMHSEADRVQAALETQARKIAEQRDMYKGQVIDAQTARQLAQTECDDLKRELNVLRAEIAGQQATAERQISSLEGEIAELR